MGAAIFPAVGLICEMKMFLNYKICMKICFLCIGVF